MLTNIIGLCLIIYWFQLLIIFLNIGGIGNLILILIYIEILLFSLVLLLNSISYIFDDILGSYLTLLLLPIAGCESAIGLMIILQFYPHRGTITI